MMVLIALLFTNPVEEKYLQQIGQDYGGIHSSNEEMSVQELRMIGEGRLHSYIFWGRYTYTYGNISVVYYGILGQIIYHSSHRRQADEFTISA